jgi:hypothetical protein
MDSASLLANCVMASSILAPEYCIPTRPTECTRATENRDAEISSTFVSLALSGRGAAPARPLPPLRPPLLPPIPDGDGARAAAPASVARWGNWPAKVRTRTASPWAAGASSASKSSVGPSALAYSSIAPARAWSEEMRVVPHVAGRGAEGPCEIGCKNIPLACGHSTVFVNPEHRDGVLRRSKVGREFGREMCVAFVACQKAHSEQQTERKNTKGKPAGGLVRSSRSVHGLFGSREEAVDAGVHSSDAQHSKGVSDEPSFCADERR